MSDNAINNVENKEKEKVLAGLPYLYRSNGLPCEVYEVRFKEDIDQELLDRAISDTIERHPYFGVRFEENNGDFYSVKNELPLKSFHTLELIPLGGKSNNYHMMGISFFEKILKISFHHGLTDGRGAKSFLETLVNYYADYDVQKKQADSSGKPESRIQEVSRRHHEKASELSQDEYHDPCESKYELYGKGGKVDGLERKGFKLPETENKSGHRRYELRFSQNKFMSTCKKYGASPITFLSIIMSRGIRKIYPENDKPINSNFPMDARKILGCDSTFKNCVKSMGLPYGEHEKEMSMEELAAHYKALLNAQKEHDYCAKEFNNIVMLLNVLQHIHSFKGRQKLLGFMENLSLNTYLISYIGQFDVPERYIDSVHLYSTLSSGLVLNMTCQSGDFIIDMVQDFASDAYVNALKQEFEAEGIVVEVSDEILFETPYDELAENIEPSVDTSEHIKHWMEAFATAAKASTQAAKERAAAAQAMSPAITAMYYDLNTGKMVEFDPTKNTKEQIESLVNSTPSIFAS